MSADAAGRHPGLLAAALARAESWLLAPAPPKEGIAERASAAGTMRPLIAVVGLSPGCGATTVARALAARLAARDPSSAAIVAGPDSAPPFSPVTPAAARLAKRVGSPVEAAGRLCLAHTDDYAALAVSARDLAPVVFDVPRDRSPAGAVSLADLTVLVAPRDAEPALAELASRPLERPGRKPLIVANRAADPSRWKERAQLMLPESRAGARLAAAGWEARGPLGAAVSRLGEVCEAAA